MTDNDFVFATLVSAIGRSGKRYEGLPSKMLALSVRPFLELGRIGQVKAVEKRTRVERDGDFLLAAIARCREAWNR